MFVMTRLANGNYLMVYEYFGAGSGKVYYKITSDITSWNPEDPGRLLESKDGYTVIGAPACIWTSIGSDGGLLIASGKKDTAGTQNHYLFVSFDYGESWTTMENPLPYDHSNDVLDTNRIGHSPSFIVGDDPSVIYYVNTTDVPESGRQRIQFARLRIYE